MGTKKEKESVVENVEGVYELEAPDGGWGYVVVAATVVIFGTTVVPLAAFGLIYGNFLRSIGDETTGTTMSNAIFNTVLRVLPIRAIISPLDMLVSLSLMELLLPEIPSKNASVIHHWKGLLANGLLSRYSYRKVGFMGSILFLSGGCGLVFAQNLLQLITFFGVIQGIGFGLLMPASLSAFNSYFNKRMAVMMSICQASMIAFNMFVPQLAALSMATFGFRGTLIGLLALSSLCLPAVASLQPVKRHMRKVYTQTINSTVVPLETQAEILKSQEVPLTNQHQYLGASQRSLHTHLGRSRKSVISLGDRFASVTAINEIKDYDNKNKCLEEEDLSFWQSFLKSMDMSLLKDPKYLNISVGLALCYTGDMAFISIIPLMLGNIGLKQNDIALMMAVFFGSDLVSRILLTIVSSIVKFRSRYLVLFTSVFIVVARTALVSNDAYTWKLVFLGILGFLRCFIQTPLPLVISEEYSDNFATAYSLFMAVNGVVSLICGPLMSLVKSYTQSDVMVCHILTVCYVICVIAWTSEITFFRKKTRKVEKK